jgi:hypothetical protein
LEIPSIADKELTDCPFQAHAQQILGFYRELHGQFLKYFLTKAINDHRNGIFSGDSSLLTIK